MYTEGRSPLPEQGHGASGHGGAHCCVAVSLLFPSACSFWQNRTGTGKIAADGNRLGRTHEPERLATSDLLPFDHIDPHHCARKRRSDRNPGLGGEADGSRNAAEGDVIDLPCSHGLDRQPCGGIGFGCRIARLLRRGGGAGGHGGKHGQWGKAGDEVRCHVRPFALPS